MVFVLPSDTDPDPTPAPTPGASKFVLPSDLDEPEAGGGANPNGILANSQNDGVLSSTAKSLGTIGVGGVSGAAGMFGSIRDLSRELGDRAFSYVTGKPLDEVRARGDAGVAATDAQSPWGIHFSQFPTPADVAGKITPITGAYEPTTEVGRLAQSGGTAVAAGALLAPEAGLVNAGANLVGGVAGQAASDLGASPLASSIVGMGAGAGAGALGSSAITPALSKSARLASVGNVLKENMSDPEKTTATILSPPAPNIPNESLTTYQTTASAGAPDAGLGQLEREISRAVPAAFIEKASGASAAQIAAKKAIQSGGSPEDVGNFVTGQMRKLDSQWDDAQQQATQTAQGAVAPLGGEQPLSVYGQRIANELTPAYEAARAPAVDQVNALGGTQDPQTVGQGLRSPVLDRQDVAGQARSELYRAVDPEGNLNVVSTPLRAAHDDIYGELSPYAAQPVGEEDIIKGILQGAPDVMLFKDLQALDTRVFNAMKTERKDNGESPAWARLAQQKNAVMDTMNEGVANQVAYERQQVARGAMAPDDTIEANLQGWKNNFYDNKNTQAVSSGMPGPSSRSGSSPAAGVYGTAGQGRGQTGRVASASGIPQGLAPNFDEAALGRLNAAKSAHADYSQTFKQGPVGAMTKSSGVSGQFKMSDAAVPDAMIQKGPKGLETIRAYRKAAGDDPAVLPTIRNYLAYKLRQGYLNPDGTVNAAKYPTFRRDYDGVFRGAPELAPQFDSAAHATAALEKFGKFNPQYAPTNVPDLFFTPGEAGADGVRQLRSLVGRDRADPLLTDVATNLMRTHAERNGVIDPARLADFNRKYAGGMSQMPGLASKFADAGKATEQIAETAAQRKQAISDFQKGAVGRLIGVSDPTTVQRVVGSIFNRADAVPVMRRLVGVAMRDRSGVAMDGLRQAVADHITQQFTTPGGFKPGTFATFWRKQQPVLNEVFSTDQMNSWGPLVKSIEATNASNTQTKIGTGSDSAQNMIGHLKAAAEKGHESNLFEKLWKSALLSRELVEPVLEHVGMGGLAMPISMVGAVGSNVISAFRNAGIAKTSDLLKAAMLDPAIAKTALMKASQRANEGSERTLITHLRRLSVLGPQTYSKNNQSNFRRSQ